MKLNGKSVNYHVLIVVGVLMCIVCAKIVTAMLIDYSGKMSQKQDGGRITSYELYADSPSVTEYEQSNILFKSELYALSCAIIDGRTGRILLEKDGFTERPMASTTKIMTLIVALENSNDDEIVKIPEEAVRMPKVRLGFSVGDEFKLHDLYYSMMLESHNDTAYAIADHVGGSVEEFVKLMNDKARELELDSTYFITPNGLDDSDENGIHSTTACELAQIMKYCLYDSPKKDEFIAITQKKEYQFTDCSQKRTYKVYNRNNYLDMDSDCVSGKTGFTNDAGYCYVGAVENEGRSFIIALLGCGWPYNKNYKWEDMKKLVSYAEGEFRYRNVISEDILEKNGLDTIRVIDGALYCDVNTNELNANDTNELNANDTDTNELNANVEIKCTTDANLSILLSDRESVRIECTKFDELMAPVTKGETVGEIKVFIDDKLYTSFLVYAGESVEKKDYKYCLMQLIDRVCIY